MLELWSNCYEILPSAEVLATVIVIVLVAATPGATTVHMKAKVATIGK
jgi:hypothetical protein